MIRSLIPLLLVFILLSCSETVEEPYDATALIPITEEFRYQQAADDTTYFFESIRYVESGINDKIFVANEDRLRIRIYDASGELLTEIGREGQGPGEFLRMGGVHSFPDGGFAVLDQRNGRVAVFSGSGQIERHILVAASTYSDDDFQVDTENNVYVKGIIGGDPRTNSLQYAWFKYNSDGIPVDTVEVPVQINQDTPGFMIFSESGDAFPFVNKIVSTITKEGVLVSGNNKNYSLDHSGGSQNGSINRDIEPVKLTEGEAEQWGRWEDYYDSYGGAISLTETKPYIRNIRSDSDGRIWVRPYVQADSLDENYYSAPLASYGAPWYEPPTYDIFSPQGDFIGRIRFPNDARFHDSRGNKVWVSRRGENGARDIVRYRMDFD